jgi:hypothetical protein
MDLDWFLPMLDFIVNDLRFWTSCDCPLTHF